ncbi:NAD-dependent epimerase/dehydratase family protein [Microbacterium sp. zg.Y1090]|uniref:NAD-dependent epimerase/dehydratase family protein n=1 Tax=Microbacterium TaxID=33882 RepID=UPI00214CDC8D|nr:MULTISPECIES: NAD-dependent epimerase/dehydratase family protein [unclassified Microbacterium]MCR2813645.1 NAD-dependent epimerase/dehydratase family protein [Microbacterium sp. zg.Y1084]MCR2818022.1 NAD-dependent epimerase/dehydratase family protein [Microbacterium sp. zg.Y1090]MDL5488127.1 NAD-dependent epimerase/dehydratase family protein [Microbacterium sp. zg-Y1211]WIM27819.1 NAD-dependent epimerase/dehydratase family protein [Microbacterium sp. zg-Y1090]
MTGQDPARSTADAGARRGARVLVTGGAGFLGTHVIAALAEVPGVDLVVAGDVRSPVDPPAGVLHEHLDVTRRDTVDPVLRRHRIDVVVHLAAIVSPGRDHDQEYRVDVDGTCHVLEACLETNVRRIVVSSSGAAYGYHADNPPWLREHHPVRGNEEFPYAKHKRLVEQLLAAYRMAHPELEQTVFRIGTILGPSVRNQITALWDGPGILAVRGSDSPFVFAWVDDVAAAMARAATDGPPGVYNVAGDGCLTVREIASRLGKPVVTVPPGLLAAALRLAQALRLTVHGPEQVGFLRHRPVLANDALKQDFGFTPSRTSAEAFEEYLTAHPRVARRRRAAAIDR